MSVLESPAPILVVEQGDNDAPYAYTVPASGEVEPSASVATFDGSGASGDFLCALVFRAQSGEVLMRVFPQATVPAGDVAQVSYAPFPGGLISKTTPGAGIQFDTLNVGDWLSVETVDSSGNGILFQEDGDGGIFLHNQGNGGLTLRDEGNDGILLNEFGSGGVNFQDHGGGGFNVNISGSGGGGFAVNNVDSGGTEFQDSGGGGIFLNDHSSGNGLVLQETGNSFIALNTQLGPNAPANGVFVSLATAQIFTVLAGGGFASIIRAGSDGIGFFGVAQAPQQPTPVTLADVIALLQAYGLAA